MTLLRTSAAAVSVGLLLALAGWSMGTGRVTGPARVEAATEFRISHAGDGLVSWALYDGAAPGGPVIVANGVMQGDRGDPVSVERAPALQAGQRVQSGETVALVRSSHVVEEVATLTAETTALVAEQSLVEAGGRPETIARAARAVSVAMADLAQAEAELAHLEGLAASGAGATWPVEEARRTVQVRRAERDLALADQQEARLPARPEEIEALQARRAVVEAQLAAAQGRVDGQAVASPIDGTVALTGGDVLVSIFGDGPAMLHVAVDEADRDAVSPGDRLRFTPTASIGSPVDGTVLAVGAAAGTMGGESVIWLVASLEQQLPVGATGRARLLSGGPL